MREDRAHLFVEDGLAVGDLEGVGVRAALAHVGERDLVGPATVVLAA